MNKKTNNAQFSILSLIVLLSFPLFDSEQYSSKLKEKIETKETIW